MDDINKLKMLADPLYFVKEFAQHAPVGIQIYDPRGHSIFVNEQFNKMFGVAPPPDYCCLTDENATKMGYIHLIHKAFAGEPGKIPLSWYDPRDLSAHKEYTKNKGKKAAIETTMIPILSSEGAVSHVIFVFRDVTSELYKEQERETALKERDDAKALFATVLDQTQAVVYTKSLAGNVTFVNGQYCRIFNLTLDQIIGKTDHELFPKEVADAFRKNDIYVQESGEHLEAEETALHSDGSEHTYISLKFPLRDSAGQIYGTCGISTDVTQYRQMEKELSQSKRMEAMGLLAGGIAHDFNNALTSILLVTDTLLLQGSENKKKWRSHIESIQTSAQRSAALTRRLLTLGSPQESVAYNIDLEELVNGNKDILSNALGADIQYRIELADNLWPLHIHPSKVEQILMNLFFNARDAMPKGGNLTLRAKNTVKSGREFVHITVADDGMGMKAEVVDRIFEPFFTTKTDTNRTGLGLTTVYGIVQRAGGSISVESSLGNGSSFHIFLPKAMGSVEAPKHEASRPLRSFRGEETILLVEDQKLLRKVTADLLREQGYTVVEAGDSAAALKACTKLRGKVDLILTDIIMPGINGLELVQKLSKKYSSRSFKTLFVSAYSEKKLSEYSFRQETVHFLDKPYTASELLTKLREILNV